jgi:hypothetical protein
LGASGAVPQQSFRCLLLPNAVGLQAPKPTLALDVSKDGTWLVDPSSNAPVASAWRAQVTAAPATHRPANHAIGMSMPVLVVSAPGWQPLAIGSPGALSWRGEVPAAAAPGYVVSDADWPLLVDHFGLSPQLTSRRAPTAAFSGGRMVRGRQRLGIGGWLFRILVFGFGLLLLYFGANVVHRYQVGTPTKVTVTYCSTGKGAQCTGSWTIDGASQTGQIEELFHDHSVGSTVDAHVLGRTAYTSTAAILPLGIGGAMTIGAVVSVVRRRRR